MAMAPGRKALRKLQFGREATPGTAVAATTIWRGGGAVLEDDREVVEVDEDVGILGRTDRTHIPKLHGKLALSETPATFEQLQQLLANGLGGPIAGTADGVGTGKIYQNDIPTTSVPTNRAWTMQGGDDAEVEQGEYAKVTKISLNGTINKALMMSAELMTRQVARLHSGFTPALALPVTEDILVNLGKMYLDNVSGAYRATQVAEQILGIKLDIELMWLPKFTMDGQLYFTFAHYVGHKITGEITFEHDAATGGAAGANGEKAKWRAQTPRLLGLLFEGSTLTTAGTYSKKTLAIDLPIKWTKFDKLDDQDENDIVTGKFTSRYNTTAGNAGKFITVNEVAALP
jgi:hypothetical protein